MQEIKQQITDIITKINQKNPYYLVAGVLAALLVLDYFLVLRYQLGALGKIVPELATISNDLYSGKANIQSMPQNLKEWEQLKQRLEKVNEKIKSEEQIPAILESISRAASRNSVRIEKIAPISAQKKSVLKNNDGEYFSIPIEIEASGGYHNFGRFLNQIEQEEVFLSIIGFSISAKPNDINNHLIRLSLDAVILEKGRQ